MKGNPCGHIAAAALSAALLLGCAQAPPIAAPEPPKALVRGAPAAGIVRKVVLHGPAEGDDLENALQAFDDQPLDAELGEAAATYVRDYYQWLEWRNLRVLVDSQLDEAGNLNIIATADPPAELPDPPGILAAPDDIPVPAPREPGGARIETALDESFRPWLQSGSRVLIDAKDRRLYLKRDGGQIISYAVAVGTPRTPTPPGNYTVEGIRHKPTWYPPESIRKEHEAKGKPLAKVVPPGRGNPLGDWFVALQNSIGIHGTNQPRSIGRAASHGCIRMHDRDVAELVKALRRGDGVTIVRARPAVTATR